ncbi:BLUF domain-containing protein [Litorivita sp. NS0012-18]|uniref:BLUF domain-containing protein n=1 Tax=Litorivita sp. NS0012-18 TaxID=3127655 RepID=UPI003342D6D7
MLQLLYRSFALLPEIDSSNLAIVQAALTHNPKVGISGYLWRAETQFFQALHGPTAAVQALMERIKADPRHHSVEILLQEQAQPSSPFEGWSMGYDLIGIELAGFGLDAQGQRPEVDALSARQLYVEMAQAARDAAQFGSAFPYARQAGESEEQYFARLNAAT